MVVKWLVMSKWSLEQISDYDLSSMIHESLMVIRTCCEFVGGKLSKCIQCFIKTFWCYLIVFGPFFWMAASLLLKTLRLRKSETESKFNGFFPLCEQFCHWPFTNFYPANLSAASSQRASYLFLRTWACIRFYLFLWPVMITSIFYYKRNEWGVLVSKWYGPVQTELDWIQVLCCFKSSFSQSLARATSDGCLGFFGLGEPEWHWRWCFV